MKYQFNFEGDIYRADIIHFVDISGADRKLYSVKEDTFLVHLSGPAGTKTFELFIEAGDMEMTWKTQSQLMIDPEICEIIGRKIDNVHL